MEAFKSLSQNAVTRPGRSSSSIQIFAPQSTSEMLLASNFNKKREWIYFPNVHQIQSDASGTFGKKMWCCACIFNRDAQFNPTLTFTAQGLIPSPAEAFVWGSPSPLTPSLQRPSKSILADLHSGFLLTNKTLSQVYIAPPPHLLIYPSVLSCWQLASGISSHSLLNIAQIPLRYLRPEDIWSLLISLIVKLLKIVSMMQNQGHLITFWH